MLPAAGRARSPEARRAGVFAGLAAGAGVIAVSLAIAAAGWFPDLDATPEGPGTGPDGSITPCDRGFCPEPADAITDEPFEFLAGGRGRFADFAGEALVVNFWASTCEPCLEEMPDLESLSLSRNDVRVIGVNVSDSVRDARRLARQTGVTYDLVRDPDGSIFRDSGAAVLPTTLFVDGQGAIVELHTGILDADELQEKVDDLVEPR